MQENFGKKAKRLLCGLLAFAVLAGYLPAPSVFAAEDPDEIGESGPAPTISSEGSSEDNDPIEPSEGEDILEIIEGGPDEIVPVDETAPEDGETQDEAVDEEPTEEPAAEPAGAERPAAKENVPEEVQAFLNAVAKLPDVIRSAEDYDAVEAAMQDILPLFQALTEEDYNQDGVSAAQEKLVSLQEQLGMGRPVEAAYDKWANWNGNITFGEGRRSNWTDEIERDGGSITKLIYDDGFYAFRGIQPKYCPYCGYHFGDSLGKEYLISGFGYEYSNAVGVIGDEVDIADNPVLLDGVQSPAITFTTEKLGTDVLWVQFFVNFHARWNSNSAACPRCWNTVLTQPDDSWYLYTDYFEVTVQARYMLKYDGNGTGVTNVPAPTTQDTTATSMALSVTTAKPTREGYKFLGWSEDPNATTATYTGGEGITLNWSEGYGSSANPVSKTLYAIWEEKEPEKAPEAPERDDLYGIMENFVEVKCVTPDEEHPTHQPQMYSTVGNYSDAAVGAVEKVNGVWTCTVTLYGETYAKFYGFEPIIGTGVDHTLAEGEASEKTITLTWNTSTQKWQAASEVPVVFMVVCAKDEPQPDPDPQNPKLDGIAKERVLDKDEVQNVDGVTYDATIVFLGNDPAPVKLLYKITVTGETGAAYKVTDEGAEWVSGGDSNSIVDGVLFVTGTIGDNGEKVIYVTKTFTAEDAKVNGGKLTNNANLAAGDDTDGPGEGPGKDQASDGGSDTQKKYNVTINFITDDEEPKTLQDPSKTEVNEGEEFNFKVDAPNAVMTLANADAIAIVVPSSIVKGDKNYALDTVLSADAIAALRNSGESGVTEDIVKDLIYSLDMVGSEDGPDGTPDKYQIKVTFKVEGGSWKDGSMEDKFIYLTKYAGDGKTMSEIGTAKLGTTQYPFAGDPAEGYLSTGAWYDKADAKMEKLTVELTGPVTFTYKFDPVKTITVTWLDADGKIIKTE